jgi:hypothetical protein
VYNIIPLPEVSGVWCLTSTLLHYKFNGHKDWSMEEKHMNKTFHVTVW